MVNYTFVDNFLGHELGDSFNSNGHRCKELKDLNFHNYVLYAGDNAGVSLDTPLEDTYPYLVSKELKVDYYNLSIFLGGADATKYNLLMWFSKFKQKPKAVIIGCEFVDSFLITDTNESFWKASDYTDPEIKEIHDHGNYTGFFRFKNLCVDTQLKECLNVPLYQLGFKGHKTLVSKDSMRIPVETTYIDHKNVASILVNEIKKLNRIMKP